MRIISDSSKLDVIKTDNMKVGEVCSFKIMPDSNFDDNDRLFIETINTANINL